MFKKLLYKMFWYLKKFFYFLHDGMMLGRIPTTLKGRKWELNITDDDFRPSVPHLHWIEDKRVKIDVYTGETYEDGINTGLLNKKEFNALWHDKKFLKEMDEARAYYKTKYPNYKLVDIPFTTDDIDENVIISRGKTKNQLIIEYKNEKRSKKKW